MTTFEFLTLLEEKPWLFAVCVFSVTFMYIKIANKLGQSWFNPVLFNVFTAGIGIGVATFLYFTGNTSIQSFTYVIVASLIYWGILLLKFPRSMKFLKVKIVNEQVYDKPLFVVLYVFSIFSTLLSYKLFGIPLFNSMEDGGSRLDTFTGSGGFGVILRLSTYLKVYCFFYLLNRWHSKKISLTKLFIWSLPFIIFGILSGSRSSFLIFLFAFWGYNLFYLGTEKKLRDFKILLIPALVISVLSFGIEHSTDISGAFVYLAQRVASCGDLYWYALPNDVWKQVSINAPFHDLFVGLFAPLRIMAESSADMPTGFQLTRLVYTDFDTNTGPVDLFTISSLVYFGYCGGLLMVIIQAFVTCLVYRLFFRRAQSLIISSFLFYSFYSCIYFFGSFRDSMGVLFEILINYIFVLIILVLLNALSKNSKV